MKTDKLKEIQNSYFNGQKKQMVEQIKAYGVKAFHIDYFNYSRNDGFSDFKGHYASVIYVFHLLNH